MNKKWVIITASVVGVVLIAGGGFGFYWFKHQSNQDIHTSWTPDISSDTASTSNQAGQGSSVLGLQSQTTQAANGNNDIGLQSDPNQTNSSSSNTNTPAQPPGPESFGQYDQYKNGNGGLFGDIVVGTGDAVKVGSKVAITYQGWLTNGKLFDQSLDKALAFTVGQHQVVLGMEQAMLGMKAGGKRRLVIPPAVGYGAQGKAGVVPPNSVMIFDVTLLSAQ